MTAWSASPSVKAAFEAIARTLPFGSMSFENKTNEQGEKLIWLGESHSDVILRIVELGD
jgi:hypothetical protein